VIYAFSNQKFASLEQSDIMQTFTKNKFLSQNHV